MIHQEEKLLYDKSQEIDWLKLRMILQKSLIWMLLIIFTTNSTAYLYLRWTKPVFVSESNLKLDIKSEAGILGFDAIDEEQSLGTISGEIELIKSRMFSERVIKSLDLGVSYYSVGKILNDERYKFSPFRINVINMDPNLFDTPLYVEFQENGDFSVSLSIESLADKMVFSSIDTIRVSNLEFTLNIIKPLNRETLETKFFFLVNSYQKLITYLETNLFVEPVNLSAKTIKVSFRDHNPYKAMDLVNSIDTLYLNYSKEEKQRANFQKIKFVDQQLLATDEKLSQIEDYLESETLGLQGFSLDNESSEVISRLKEVKSELIAIHKQHQESYSLVAGLDNGDSVWIPKFMAIHPEIIQEITDFKNSKLKLSKLRKTFSENTRIVLEEKELAEMRKRNLVLSLDKLIGSQEILLGELTMERNSLSKKLTSIPQRKNDFNKTNRYYTMYEDFYLSLMQNKTQFQIAQAGITTDFKILSQASIPASPVSPRKTIIFGIGFMSGFLICFFYIGIRYVLHNRITSIEQIESKTKLPVLGSIPFYHSEKLKASKLLVGKHPRSAISESLRGIRTNLEFFLPSKKNKILAVTSTVSGEGKTFFSVNLAGIISLSSKKVIVVDLDMRRPRVHQAFGIECPKEGVSSILIGKNSLEECIHITSMHKLHFLSAGPPPPNPSELLLKPEFDELLKKLSMLYDVIILDTPPVGLVTDGILALKKADLPIYVLRSDFSKTHYLETLMRLNKIHKFSNLTVLLNSIKMSSQGYGYGYGEGY